MLNRFGFRTLLMLMLLVLSLGLLAAGCGDDDDDSGDSADTVEMTTTEETDGGEDTTAEEPADVAPQVIEIPTAESGLAYAVTEVTAAPGTITLTTLNEQSVPHNIAIDEPTQQIGEIVQDGGTSEITITIDEPGEYEYYCSVPGHREAGMVGKLIVE
ncbi:MAG: plastocyanin/azurin family copper-binding protein [Thermoleophilia bacterium]|nr:plastocyanin/azurin family copper-binding protein [Thermoleophilia bacterium]MDH3725821.1 plastocyanin/azurin family copper-binding protein [Thermoleophilia bacterium]